MFHPPSEMLEGFWACTSEADTGIFSSDADVGTDILNPAGRARTVESDANGQLCK